jgi:Protein of unknown function (DUF3455)
MGYSETRQIFSLPLATRPGRKKRRTPSAGAPVKTWISIRRPETGLAYILFFHKLMQEIFHPIALATPSGHARFQKFNPADPMRSETGGVTCYDGLRMRSGRRFDRGFVSPLTGSGTSMRTRLLFTFAAIALFPEFAFPQSQDIPPALVVQQGATLLGKYAAQGAQIYVCRAKGATNEWAFKAPDAKLVDAEGRPFARHYAGPSWEAPDGSKVVGKVLANEPAPKASAIPWLLLSAESSTSGALAGVHFVQRVNTSGGVAPTGSCPTAGAEQRVDYTADYIFYK